MAGSLFTELEVRSQKSEVRSQKSEAGKQPATGVSSTDWSEGGLACMSAKHEKALEFLRSLSRYAAEATALQARMPALQSVDFASRPGTLVLRQLTSRHDPESLHRQLVYRVLSVSITAKDYSLSVR